MQNNDYKKGIKTESRNQYTSYVLSLIKWEFEYTLFASQDELVDRLLSTKDKIFLKH
jgi:hypothetical protein